ncbi:hypothetical protein BDW74DRAFT_158808 [Aspergillus multicolor]|uniref:uncharacterized protein n=1 Tax=Aspergillus multicolor TaxID=41759 RepID=UPI003CCDCA85
MAEIIGVAVGVVNLLEQTIETISKLRALRTFIKSAPTDLQDLLEEIEIVQAVLMALKPTAFDFLKLPSIERRLQAFQNDLDSLIVNISAYQKYATKGRLGLLKLALKKETIKAHRQNFDGFKSTLLLLQQAHYSASLQEMSLRKRLHSLVPRGAPGALADSDCSTDKCSQMTRHKRRKQLDRGRRGFRFRTPLFFVDKMWTISSYHAVLGWKFTLEVHNVIPDNAPVMRYCRIGEVEVVRRLFSEGLASPFDCNANGETLLHIAVRSLDVDMCQFLLDAGVDPNHGDNNHGVTCCQLLDMRIAMHGITPDQFPGISAMYRLCFNDTDADLLVTMGEEEWNDGQDANHWQGTGHGFGGPPEALTILNSLCFNRYSDIPLTMRFNRAVNLNIAMNQAPNPGVIRVAMGGGPQIDPAAFLLENNGETLLHKIAEGIGADISAGRTKNLNEWRRLLAEAVSAGSDLNKVAHYDYRADRTPFLAFRAAFGPCAWRSYWRHPNNFTPILRLWAAELQRAGADLESYGEKERDLYTSSRGLLSMPIWLDCDKEPGKLRSLPEILEGLWVDVVYLEFGPEPEDWCIYVTNPVDELVGEFWEVVVRGLEVMPGTWVD